MLTLTMSSDPRFWHSSLRCRWWRDVDGSGSKPPGRPPCGAPHTSRGTCSSRTWNRRELCLLLFQRGTACPSRGGSQMLFHRLQQRQCLTFNHTPVCGTEKALYKFCETYTIFTPVEVSLMHTTLTFHHTYNCFMAQTIQSAEVHMPLYERASNGTEQSWAND